MTEPTTPRPRRRRAAVLLLAVGAVITASGTWAAWQSNGSLTQNISSATVAVDVEDGGTATAIWSNDIDDLLPGDYFHRWMDVTNTGSVTQSFEGVLSSDGDLSGALTAWVASCDVAWSGGSSTSCSGTETDLLGTSGSPGSPVAFGALGGLGDIDPNETRHLLVRVTFDAGAAQGTYENKSSTVTLAVTGTATGGADRTES